MERTDPSSQNHNFVQLAINYSGRKAPSLKMQMFFFVVVNAQLFEIAQYGVNADWIAPLMIMLFARADHMWAKYMGR